MESKELLHRVIEWDRKVILKYNGIGGKPFTYFLKIVSFFGRETIWLILMAYYLFIWYDPYLFAHISITFLIGIVLIASIRNPPQEASLLGTHIILHHKAYYLGIY